MRRMLGLAAAAVFTITGFVGGAPVTQASCAINAGWCIAGNCAVNTGTCDDGGRCTVNLGTCTGNGGCLVNVRYCSNNSLVDLLGG